MIDDTFLAQAIYVNVFYLVYDRNCFGIGFRPKFRFRPKLKNHFGIGYLANSAQIVSPKATLRALINYYPQNLFVSMCGAIFGALGDND